MAKVQLTDAVLKAAIAAHCEGAKKEFSEGEQAGTRVFVLAPGDIIAYQENGKLICPDQATYEALSEILMDMAQESTRPRQSEDKPPKGMNVPARTKPGAGPAMPSSALTLEKVREYFCKTATDEECAFALEVCQIRGLNPFKADCYLVKYGGANPKLEILVSNSFLLKKAMSNPDFEYFKAGVTVQRGEDITDVRREYAYPGEVLLGGWAEIKRKSIGTAFWVGIPLAGNKGNSHFWNDTPGHMIRKTASSQVCREAFPEELAGLYDVDEMGIDPSKEVGEA